MLNLKKTALAVLAFGSSAVFAGTMGPVCTPGSVTVPCPRTAWDFGAQALYLQPTASHLDYAGSTLNIATQSQVYNKNTPWGWGFQIEGSYHYNTGNDVDVNWYHLDRSKNGIFAIGGGQTFNDAFGEIWGAGSSVSVNGSSKWDAVNLEFGQHIDMGEFVNMRVHGGFEYAHIKSSLGLNGNLGAGNIAPLTSVASTATNFIAIGTAQSTNTTISYNGFGPRIGTDLGYGWNNGLAVYAKGAAAVLVGSNKFTRTSSTAINGAGSVTGSSTTVNPELETKVGATYTYAMAQGDLSVDLGWMWINYFSVQQDGISGAVRSSDFGLQGPFVGLKWVGNVA